MVKNAMNSEGNVNHHVVWNILLHNIMAHQWLDRYKKKKILDGVLKNI